MRYALQILLGLFVGVLAGRAENPTSTSNVSNMLVWDAVKKSINLPGMTNTVSLTFWVTNISQEEVTMLSTETSCDCTVADAAHEFPWKIAPGTGGPLYVRIHTIGQHGLIERYIAVRTSHGVQFLTAAMNIQLSPAPFNVSVRQQDVMAAKADRQSVFEGHCAACHTWPTKEQTGEALFQSACAICHISDNRADFVPDLFALKHPNEPEYWRNVITHGKPNTLMPAFSKSERGILDTNQIESLVSYLVEKFPSKDSPPPKPNDYLLQQ